MASKFSGQMYQFRTERKLGAGDYVRIDGPHDTFGRVIASTLEGKTFLNLIRGCKEARGLKPVASF